jgi:hypothetical protein
MQQESGFSPGYSGVLPAWSGSVLYHRRVYCCAFWHNKQPVVPPPGLCRLAVLNTERIRFNSCVFWCTLGSVCIVVFFLCTFWYNKKLIVPSPGLLLLLYFNTARIWFKPGVFSCTPESTGILAVSSPVFFFCIGTTRNRFVSLPSLYRPYDFSFIVEFIMISIVYHSQSMLDNPIRFLFI